MANITLYAWAVPALVSAAPVDHTWVTTYDNRVNSFLTILDVVNAGEYNWFCWGDFHPRGGTPSNPTGSLGSRVGDFSLASCLVQPNAKSFSSRLARGTIFTYGIDGVCHQLTNQVLYATGLRGALPMTVSQANGYQASLYLYRTYGLQLGAWSSKIATCSASRVTSVNPIGEASMGEFIDEFAVHVRSVLTPTNPNLVEQLLAMRDQIQSQRSGELARRERRPVNAEALNIQNKKLLDQAAALLGRDQFVTVFGFPPEQRVDLVDQNIADRLVPPDNSGPQM